MQDVAPEDHWLLRPKQYYAQTGRAAQYATMVSKLKKARAEHLQTFPELEQELIEAVAE